MSSEGATNIKKGFSCFFSLYAANIRIYNPANEIAKLESQKKSSKSFAVSKIIRIFAIDETKSN
jgi:hypothetical protein